MQISSSVDLSEIITPLPREVQVGVVPGTASWIAVGSTITGWAFPVGVVQNFQRVRFQARSSVDGYSPSIIRVRIRETNSVGAIIADEQIAVVMVTGVEQEITITFSSAVANASAAALWFELLSDGRLDFHQVTPQSFSSPAARYWTDGSVLSPTTGIVVSGGSYNYLVSFLAIDATQASTFELTDTMKVAVNNSPLVSFMATPVYGFDVVSTIGTVGAIGVISSSTFSGWGQYVGNITVPFSGVRFYLYAFEPTLVPTQVVVRVRRMPADTGVWATESPHLWEVLRQVTLNVAPANSTLTLVTADFGVAAQFTGDLWVEHVTNGRTGTLLNSAIIPAPPKTKYQTGALLDSTTWQTVSTHENWYLVLGNPTSELIDFIPSEALKQKVGGSSGTAPVSVGVQLPTTIYALEGRELNLYWDGVLKRDVPLENLLIDVACTKGAQFKDFWRYTPVVGDVGTTTLRIDVKTRDAQTLLTSKTISLITKALSHPSTPVSRKVLIIGDSTTDNTGVLSELINLFDGDAQYTLTEVGTHTGSVNDSGGTPRSVASEAISGKSFNFFYTDATSPFVFSGAFNFATYLSTNAIVLSSGDWVIFNLGINDVFSLADDANLVIKINTMASQLAAMITNIKSAVSGIRLGVALTIPPNANQDAFGVNYTSSQNRLRYKRNITFWLDRLLSVYPVGAVANVTLIPLNANLDTVNNFPTATVALNARNVTTYEQPSNAVHPADSGSYQTADALRMFLKGIEA